MSTVDDSKLEQTFTLAAKVAFLKKPDSYPDATFRVQAVETHMSWVFLADRYAYKLKKPVLYPFLDFSTPAARKYDCQEEVRLNRRLAADTYVGTIPLCVDGLGKMNLSEAGTPIDWLVKMHRLPKERMLDAAIANGTVREEDIHAVARKLTRFYVTTPAAGISAQSYRAHLAESLRADWAELARREFGVPRTLYEPAFVAALGLLEREPALFDRRVAAGRVIEAHGDLRPEHICLMRPEPMVIDCLEFSRALRILDVADELSFLALECDRLGAPQVGKFVFAVYSEMTSDPVPRKLIDFYTVSRACMRAKLCLWHLLDAAHGNKTKWKPLALNYLSLARSRASHLC